MTKGQRNLGRLRQVEALSYATRGVINIQNCPEMESILSEDKNIILIAYSTPKVGSGCNFVIFVFP